MLRKTHRLYVCREGLIPRRVEWISRVPAPEGCETQLQIQFDDGQTFTCSELAWSIMLLGGSIFNGSTTVMMMLENIS